MSLANAISKNAQPITAVNATYKQNVSLVGSFLSSVLASKIPPLNNPPPNTGEFASAYSKASNDALQWADQVFARLSGTPASLLSYKKIITDLLADATRNAAALVDNPSDQIASLELQNDLSSLSSQFTLIAEFVNSSLSESTDFSKTLPDMATQLQSIANDATRQAGIDQGQIDNINQDVAKLRSDINSLNAAITGLHAAEDTEVSIGLAILGANWLAGIIAGLVIAGIIAVEEVFIHFDTDDIAADKKKIEDDLSKIPALQADIAALNLLASNYSAMSDKVSQMEGAMAEVVQQWTALQSDVQGAITDINDALREENAESFQAILNDLQLASSEWNLVVEQAGSLAISVKVNDAKVTPGMSQDDVKAAIANGKSLSLVEYFNQPAAS